MAYKYPKQSSFKTSPLLPNSAFPKSIFFALPSLSAPAPALIHPSSHSSQKLRDRKWILASCHFTRQLPRANELQPWLWNGSVSLINDWGSAAITSPLTPQSAPTAQLEKKKQGRNTREPCSNTSTKDKVRRGKPAFPENPRPPLTRRAFLFFFSEDEQAGEKAEEEKFSSRTFHTLLDKVVRSREDTLFLRNSYMKHAGWKRNCPKFSLVIPTSPLALGEEKSWSRMAQKL